MLVKAGFEPTTFGLRINSFIHCATHAHKQSITFLEHCSLSHIYISFCSDLALSYTLPWTHYFLEHCTSISSVIFSLLFVIQCAISVMQCAILLSHQIFRSIVRQGHKNKMLCYISFIFGNIMYSEYINNANISILLQSRRNNLKETKLKCLIEMRKKSAPDLKQNCDHLLTL